MFTKNYYSQDFFHAAANIIVTFQLFHQLTKPPPLDLYGDLRLARWNSRTLLLTAVRCDRPLPPSRMTGKNIHGIEVTEIYPPQHLNRIVVLFRGIRQQYRHYQTDIHFAFIIAIMTMQPQPRDYYLCSNHLEIDALLLQTANDDLTVMKKAPLTASI